MPGRRCLIPPRPGVMYHGEDHATMISGPSRHTKPDTPRPDTPRQSGRIRHVAAALACALILGGCPGEFAFAPIRSIDRAANEPRSEEELVEMEDDLRRLQERQAARAAQTRRMTLLPDPEPVVVEPLPDFDPAIDPARP